MSTPDSRREFLSQLALGGLALGVGACASSAAPASTATSAQAPSPSAPVRPGRDAPPIPIPPTTGDGPWDMSWLERVDRAKYRMMFDIGAYAQGGGLRYARNYLNGIRDGWNAEAPDVIAVLGISGDAYPIVFDDAMWEKYGLGEWSKTNDPRTHAPSVRNVWWQPRADEPMADFGVDVLQRRGAQVIFCNNVFRGVIRTLMARTGRAYADVRGELKAHFLPGVIVVPAMVAAMGMAQHHGCAYVYAGG
jgi:hypothetical protein